MYFYEIINIYTNLSRDDEGGAHFAVFKRFLNEARKPGAYYEIIDLFTMFVGDIRNNNGSVIKVI